MRVRTRCSFGQEKGKSGRASPNLVHIRTGKGETGEERVRTRSPFGQEKEKSGRVSPNPVLIRTGKGETGECESEPGLG
ncbi:hypothetical protein [Cytobacillus oceanisediminis]|uniref:hypothetical protein n=1 Tax=Cytobacillus oceanisediminis TaxID=665099 RepID=UPI001C2360CF|nr:hypothetical protein [Cytobacillus oceanisediminis]MBU8772481.1 hypothetical protein [Cytobacillus oceanisediminis]